jgi:hypothetical protein
MFCRIVSTDHVFLANLLEELHIESLHDWCQPQTTRFYHLIDVEPMIYAVLSTEVGIQPVTKTQFATRVSSRFHYKESLAQYLQNLYPQAAFSSGLVNNIITTVTNSVCLLPSDPYIFVRYLP